MWSREVKNVSFPIFDNKTEFQKKKQNDIIFTKKICVQMWNGLVLRKNNPSSTKEIIEIGIFSIFRCFSKKWNTRER